MNWRHILLAALLVGLLSPQAESKILVGVRVGSDMTDVSNTAQDKAPYKPKFGFVAGAAAEWISSGFNPLKSGVRLEALYTQKGWKDQVMRVDEEGRELGYRTTGTVSVDELVLTALYTLHLGTPVVSPFVELGPQAGFPLSAKEKMVAELGGQTWNDAWNWRNVPNLGLVAGGGITFPGPAFGEFSAELRYDLGLTNMTSAHGFSRIRTNGLQLLLGYSLRVL